MAAARFPPAPARLHALLPWPEATIVRGTGSACCHDLLATPTTRADA